MVKLLVIFLFTIVAIGIAFGDENFTVNNAEFNVLLNSSGITIKSNSELMERLNAFQRAKDSIQNFQTQYPAVTFELNRFALMTQQELRKVR